MAVPGKRNLDIRIDFVGAPSFNAFGDAAADWLRDILAEHRKVLVFANTRAQCDWHCPQLSDRIKSVPVLLHYSSLHRTYRERVEKEFREHKSAVCIATSTLELGIDIGDVDAIAMWGTSNTVSSFLQRLGRGNRRTDTSILERLPKATFASPFVFLPPATLATSRGSLRIMLERSCHPIAPPCWARRMTLLLQVSFNPTMVRLLLVPLAQSEKFAEVSIPLWCDCCKCPPADAPAAPKRLGSMRNSFAFFRSHRTAR